MKTLAARVESLRRSEIRVLFDAADDQPNAIRLEVGEPSFTTPAHIIDAAAAAAREGHTGYGPNGGLESLRHLLSDKILRVNGFSVVVSNTFTTARENVTTERNANYNGNFSETVSVQTADRTAVGQVTYGGVLPFGPTWIEDKLSYLIGARMLQGMKWLRPEACGEINLGDVRAGARG